MTVLVNEVTAAIIFEALVAWDVDCAAGSSEVSDAKYIKSSAN